MGEHYGFVKQFMERSIFVYIMHVHFNIPKKIMPASHEKIQLLTRATF